MDLFLLNAQFHPTMVVEAYTSLIWTERLLDHGEFTLKTDHVLDMQKLLPTGTFVSHKESSVVMQVENHHITTVGEGSDARPVLTISGREATIILEDRIVYTEYGTTRPLLREYTPAGVAMALIYNAVQNGTGSDFTRVKRSRTWAPLMPDILEPYPYPAQDLIPNVVVTDGVATEGSLRQWYVEAGSLYPQLTKILNESNVGVRALRPRVGVGGLVVTLSTPLNNRGGLQRTTVPHIPQLRFDVHTGKDRSGTVRFFYDHGHLEAPEYLTTIKEQLTGVEMLADGLNLGMYYRDGVTTPSGWARRTAILDAGTPEYPEKPEKPEELPASATPQQKVDRENALVEYLRRVNMWREEKASIRDNFEAWTRKQALAMLDVRSRKSLFNANVTSLSPYKYGTDYDLGDIVQLYGEYGYREKMRVVEFVRAEDVSGESGIPGLITI